MATASHEHIPGLSGSLSKPHQTLNHSSYQGHQSVHRPHHAVNPPLDDLWGLSLNQRPRKQEPESEYLEIARNLSRGPLMSSASASQLHETSLDESVGEAVASSTANTSTSSAGGSSSGQDKDLDSATLWKHASPASHSPQGSQSGSIQGAQPLMGLTPSASPAYLGSLGTPIGSTPLSVPLGGSSLSTSVQGAVPGSVPSAVPGSVPGSVPASSGSSIPGSVPSAPPGMGHVMVPPGAGGVPTAPVGSVGSLGQFRTGIWGPRQSFSGFNASPGPSVYGKTPWAAESHAGASTNGVPLVSKSTTPPQSSPSPTELGLVGGNSRLYSAPPAQQLYPQGAVPAPVPGAVPGAVPSTIPGAVPIPGAAPGASVAPVNSGTPVGSAGAPVSAGVGANVAPGQQHQHQQHQQHQHQHQQNHHGHQQHHGHHNHHTHHNHHDNRPQKKNGRPSTNTELYKTELCASFMSTGGNCPYGEKCQFAHGTQELKSVDRPPKWRSKPCQNWVKTGSCSYNERCCFRHDIPVGHSSS